MFAIPFSAPAPSSFVSQIFGPLMVPSVPAETHESLPEPGVAACASECDDIPDLAQRVREVGEW